MKLEQEKIKKLKEFVDWLDNVLLWVVGIPILIVGIPLLIIFYIIFKITKYDYKRKG